MKIRTLLVAAAAGSAVAYFMDSERGPQRRAVAKERAAQLKALAMPKLQELREHATADLPAGAGEDREPVFVGNGSGASTALPS